MRGMRLDIVFNSCISQTRCYLVLILLLYIKMYVNTIFWLKIENLNLRGVCYWSIDLYLFNLIPGNFYNNLITYTDGNIALTIESSIDNFDMTIPEDFDDALETLDETLQEPVYDLLDFLDDLGMSPLTLFMHSTVAMCSPFLARSF